MMFLSLLTIGFIVSLDVTNSAGITDLKHENKARVDIELSTSFESHRKNNWKGAKVDFWAVKKMPHFYLLERILKDFLIKIFVPRKLPEYVFRKEASSGNKKLLVIRATITEMGYPLKFAADEVETFLFIFENVIPYRSRATFELSEFYRIGAALAIYYQQNTKKPKLKMNKIIEKCLKFHNVNKIHVRMLPTYDQEESYYKDNAYKIESNSFLNAIGNFVNKFLIEDSQDLIPFVYFWIYPKEGANKTKIFHKQNNEINTLLHNFNDVPKQASLEDVTESNEEEIDLSNEPNAAPKNVENHKKENVEHVEKTKEPTQNVLPNSIDSEADSLPTEDKRDEHKINKDNPKILNHVLATLISNRIDILRENNKNIEEEKIVAEREAIFSAINELFIKYFYKYLHNNSKKVVIQTFKLHLYAQIKKMVTVPKTPEKSVVFIMNFIMVLNNIAPLQLPPSKFQDLPKILQEQALNVPKLFTNL